MRTKPASDVCGWEMVQEPWEPNRSGCGQDALKQPALPEGVGHLARERRESKVYKTASEDGVRRSGGRVPGVGQDLPHPSPRRIYSLSKPSGPAVPGLLVAARDVAAEGESRGRCLPGPSAAGKEALVP